jgi:hypothetical protein
MVDSSEFMMRRLFVVVGILIMASSPALSPDAPLGSALGLGLESATLEFKSSFNPNDKGAFLEVIKDVVAMANSGGGTVLFGVTDEGSLSGAEMDGISTLDPAKVTDLVYKYTDCQFHGFEVRKLEKNGCEVWAIVVHAVSNPIVFSQTGNYQDPSGKQKNAFAGGTVYFRHGAKSEPGNSDDLRLFVERRVESIRHEWLDGIAKVVEAPSGSVVRIALPGGADDLGTAVRLTTDPSAAAVPVGAIDRGWPYRQKDLVAAVNDALGGKKRVNAAHVLYIRRAFDIDSNGRFCYTQAHASAKYSHAFADWIVEQFNADATFFERAKAVADQKRSVAAHRAAITPERP